MNDFTSTTSAKTIKGYDLREYLGAGRAGAVYAALDTALDREVAIKVIDPQFANQPQFIRLFESNLRHIARLEHPHVVPIHDFWRDQDSAAVVMRLLRGGNLRQAAAHGAWSVERACLFLDQAASALHSAHRMNIVHGSLKPENLLFDEDGGVYVVDFELSALKDAAALTAFDLPSPPSDYLAPEQIRGEAALPASDIFALGLLLYEVLSGQHPFPDLPPVQRLHKHLNDLLPPLTTLPPRLADAINAVLQKATAKNPALRYADMLAFAAAFREAAQLPSAHARQSVEETLTLREHEVLQRLVDGKTNQQIAQELFLSIATVKWYNSQIYEKLQARNRVQAIIRARELHLIAPAHPTRDTPASVRAPKPINPYKGLLAFKQEDCQDFFGRETVVQKLLEHMGQVTALPVSREAKYARFLAIVGASGSGKSSLVHAGLVPAFWRGDLLQPEHWYVAEMLPGSRPLDSLEIALMKLAPNAAINLREQLQRDRHGLVRAADLILPGMDKELVLIVDQFEELFTQVYTEAARVEFLNLLGGAVLGLHSRVRIVITLRADFYDRPLIYPEFGEMVRSRMVTLLPLSPQELERAIVAPAERVGASFEPGLVASIISDVNYQPGALPLLQFTLTELFDRCDGLTITRAAYDELGGVIGGLAKHADKLYQEHTDSDKAIVRQLFLRLVTLGDGVEDTRRRVLRTELDALTADEDLLDELLDVYAANRLLLLDYDAANRTPTVEIAHEALLRYWTQLCVWLDESREDIRVQRLLMAAAEEWLNAQRDPDFLATGGRLAQFEALIANGRITLSKDEQAYVVASLDERQRQGTERELQQRRTLLLQRAVMGVLTIFLFTSLLLLISVFLSRNEALAQTGLAFARQLAAQAVAELRNPIGNDEFAVLLAIRSLHEQYDPVADGALVEAASRLPIATFDGHPDTVYSVAFSPDGRFALTGCADGIARLWEVTTRQQIRSFDGSSGEVFSVAFSPDGSRIATAHEDMTASVWDAATGEPLFSLEGGEDGETMGVAFSPDGRYIATTDNSVRLWDAQTGELIRMFAENNTGRSIAFSPDSASLLIPNLGNQATLWEVETGRLLQTYQGHTNGVYSIAFSPNGQRILTGSIDNTAILWETSTGRPILTLRGHSSSVRTVGFSPDGHYLLTGSSDHTIRLWDAATGLEVNRYTAHLARVWSAVFSPDGTTILSGSADATVKLWSVAFDRNIGIFRGHQGEVFDVTYSPRGDFALTTSADGTARIWSLASRQVVLTFDGHHSAFYSGVFSPDGNYVLTGGSDAAARLWDVTTGSEVRAFTGHTNTVFAVDFSADGRYVLTGSEDATVRIWETSTGQVVQTFTITSGAVHGAVFSPDDRFVVTSSAGGDITLWDATMGQLVWQFTPVDESVYDVDFSPDGRFIAASGVNGNVWQINASTGQLIRLFGGLNNSVYNLDFSPDGRLLAASSANRTGIIWDLASGSVVRVLRGHSLAVWGIAFSPDGGYILTGSLDHTANLWEVDYNAFVESVCARLSRDFTEEERQLVPISDQDATCAGLG
ncbi:MAG: protein kinase [Anaerolinea sp.]|nr:protein kinase [Anaerolinea sp.]